MELTCAVLEISPSTYYAAKKREENPSARDGRDGIRTPSPRMCCYGPRRDIPLDAANANAAGAARRTRVSVADAHLGAAIQAADAEQVTVITSDPGDTRRVAQGRQVNVVAL